MDIQGGEEIQDVPELRTLLQNESFTLIFTIQSAGKKIENTLHFGQNKLAFNLHGLNGISSRLF